MQVTLRRWTELAVAGAAVTGLAYGYLRYFAVTVDEYGDPLIHPWTGHLQHAHILVVPLFVLMLGALWAVHIWPYYRSAKASRRRSGLANWALALLMVLSGYAVQISVADSARWVWVWVHGVSSTLWLGTFLWHRFVAH